jgi:tRNA modification GTPase
MGEPVDTIAAVATAAGRGGIGIVRISGPLCAAVAVAVAGKMPPPRRAEYRAFRNAAGEILDRGIALYFPRPASYTGEDVLELHGHGGAVVLDLLLQAVLDAGARPARPGEFTERAFLNGRIDLVQAEAVADLIDSLSAAAARGAVRALEGEFSAHIRGRVEALVDLRARVEAALDFPEDTPDGTVAPGLRPELERWLAEMDTLLAGAEAGQLLREGLRVVIAGPPNAGKSSLLNRLVGSDRAIVAETPGTTRDTVEADVLAGGVRLRIADTAGIRSTADSVEAEGVRRSLRAAAAADLVLLVVGAPENFDDTILELAAKLPAGPRRLVVRNKIDLYGETPSAGSAHGMNMVSLSVKTGAGLDLLRGELLRETGEGGSGEGVILARARHVHALKESRAAVRRALAMCDQNGAAPELTAEELRSAQLALGRITGEFSADDLLGEIFSRFCIGK